MLALRVSLAALLLYPAATAAIFHRQSNAKRASAISLRKRLHVNPLITEPDTIDIEWGGAFSTSGNFTVPAVIHFTPEGTHVWWGRTEFSASFDSLAYQTPVTHFGDRAAFAATCLVHDGAKLDIAVAPQVSVLLRGDDGVRIGGTGIARYDTGHHSAGVTFTWTGASASSATNPAGTFDIGAGYGYGFGRITPHVNWLWEKSTGVERQVSLFEGVEYQLSGAFAVDFSLQHISLWGGARDTQLVAGITVSTGRLHRR